VLAGAAVSERDQQWLAWNSRAWQSAGMHSSRAEHTPHLVTASARHRCAVLGTYSGLLMACSNVLISSKGRKVSIRKNLITSASVTCSSPKQPCYHQQCIVQAALCLKNLRPCGAHSAFSRTRHNISGCLIVCQKLHICAVVVRTSPAPAWNRYW